jgi:formylglycine-generating enzyme
VRKEVWDAVYAWAISHGYSFDNTGVAQGFEHPVQAVNWYDAVKWCNARSEKDGLTPVYYTTVAQTTVYRSGRLDLTASYVKWSANGYRLPTEAEWEKAARGGVSGLRFPWGSSIDHARANYFSTGFEPYDAETTFGCNTSFLAGLEPFTNPGGSFPANGYGLYDMAGNVFQWCWDWAQDGWYRQSSATQADTRGPASGVHRIFRGGAWDYEADRARCSRRSQDGPTSSQEWEAIGFRCVRTLAQ